jgi:hypothetical protein
MSEEGYIKVACHECSERISLPLDGVGVAFNCPHCGVDLQMLLKHVCEHCGGRLSFEGKPEAIGVQIECGHCHQATALQPSTFAVDNAGARTEPATEEEYDEEEYDEEEYDEEEYDEEEYDEEECDDGEPEVQGRRRVGPPKPRPPRGKGLPRPPKRAGSQEALRPGQRPAKIGRTLAGAGAKPKEEQSSGGPRKRPRPKRKTRAQRSSVQPSSGPVGSGTSTRRIDETPPESQEVDPMGGVVPGGSSGAAGPVGPGPVQRKVAGTDADGPQPTFKESSSEDEGAGPWYKNREKQTLVIVIFVFLVVFIPFGLPNFVKIFDLGLGNKIERIVKLKFLFTEGDYRNNPSDDVQVDQDSIKIQPIDENSSTTFVIGEAKNTSSETLRQVELHFNLYDSTGATLGEAVEYKDEMGPNSTWSFRATCLFTNVVRADLVKVIVR